MRIERFEWDGATRRRSRARLRSLAPAPPRSAPRSRTILERVRDGRRRGGARAGASASTSRRPSRCGSIPEAVEAAPGAARARASARRCAPPPPTSRAVAAAELEPLPRPAAVELPAGPEGRDPRRAGRRAPASTPRAAGAPTPRRVLMCAIPARVAGVERLAVACPPGPRRPRAAPPCSPPRAIAGVDEVYAMGGAQAIAALAFGTETVAAGRRDRRARQPLGAGGEAARLRPGRDRRHRRAVRADGGRRRDADPRLGRARPLRAGRARRRRPAGRGRRRTRRCSNGVAEHGRGAGRRAPQRRRRRRSPWSTPPTSRRALDLANAFAPEHLRAASRTPTSSPPASRIAGCVFVGAGAATAFGDYAAGSNHVLPDRRRRALRRPARAGALHAPDLGRHVAARRPPRRWRRTSTPSPGPRDCPSTASRPRPRHGRQSCMMQRTRR